MINIGLFNFDDFNLDEYKEIFSTCYMNLIDIKIQGLYDTIKKFDIGTIIIPGWLNKTFIEEIITNHTNQEFKVLYLYHENKTVCNKKNTTYEITYPLDLKKLFLSLLPQNIKFAISNINLNFKKNLVMMVGLPRSGKTTFIEKVLNDDKYIVLSSDKLRLSLYNERFNKEFEKEMWEIFHQMFKYFISTERSIIIDSTNLDYNVRKFYIDIAKQNSYDTYIININTSIETCKYRCTDGNKDLIDVIEYKSDKIDTNFSGSFVIEI